MNVRYLFLMIGLLFLVTSLSAQKKMTGLGGELSVLGLKPTARWWITNNTGYEVFAGVAAQTEDFKPNDFEVGAKYLRAFIFEHPNRTYFGLMGKWKRLQLNDPKGTTSLPVFGAFIGKEWFVKRAHRKGFALEFGYQYGNKEYTVIDPVNHTRLGKDDIKEIPLIINIKYTFYKDK